MGFIPEFSTDLPGPFYNMVHYNMVLDKTLITAGRQMVIFDYFCYMSVYFTLVITWIAATLSQILARLCIDVW